jgi:hypothetical protein
LVESNSFNQYLSKKNNNKPKIMDSISPYGDQMLRTPNELLGFERNKIREQKIESFYLPWINKKLNTKGLSKVNSIDS